MRLFAAVVPPSSVIGELEPVARGLEGMPGAERLRWTGRPGWHFTLAFYGEVAEEVVPELSERLARAARRTEPFRLALGGGGHFGGRTLWVGASGDTGVMGLLADRAEAAARKAGVETGEYRPYRPHLTLARSRRHSEDLRPYVAALDGFAGREWTVGELCLIRSRLPEAGVPGEQPRYETVERWALGAGG
ncbi:RNA 2',3'-cyclic phosphodiesterase [Streptomyces sp. RY43-2]|uniref:RNA 2',3'-cyclic phosphodiesterase n=1 Tax=Streptomyces macrolidinus TaxID=2952607 RepID=A0ABT0ZIC7_9ACTN|nr:RNA 2',3'-cyclic phosphodiesterase [Streptomyces macrolidinus]MCN9243302.1 RNA 2',3'-cyclic phosphodiesterase [Streptomyces macrolidinus]